MSTLTNKRKVHAAFGLLPWESKRIKIDESNVEGDDKTKLSNNLLTNLMFEQRKREEIDAEKLYGEILYSQFMDLYSYHHPRPPQDNVALGNKKKPVRRSTTVARQLRLMMKKLKLIEYPEDELNSLRDHESEYIQALDKLEARKSSVRLLSEKEGQALLRINRLKLECRAVRRSLINSLANTMLDLVYNKVLTRKVYGVLAIL